MDEKNKLLKALVAIAAIFLLLAYGRKIVSILTPVVIAVLLALLLLPLVDIISKKLKSRLLGTGIVLLPAFALLLWGIWRALSQIYREAEGFVFSFPQIIANLQTLYNERILPMVRGTRYEDTFFIFLDDVILQAMSWVQDLAKSLIGSGLSFVSSLPGILLALMVTVLLVFYLTYDKKWVYNLFPAAEGNASKVIKSMHGYIKTQFFLIVITAAICMLTFSLLKIPYVFVLGLLVALLDLLPIVGPGTVLIPMSIWHFILGKPFTAIMIIVLYGIITVVRQLIEPRLLANNLNIHPIIALLSVYLGLKLFGPLGLVLLPLVSSIAASFPRFKGLRR
ncbi:MAG TPA: AI-2E family transporter [Bacillota bacterium]|jgi:sporulation integral membrane protein YtvI|nr:AI-2E family transporter [Bacillota bacterium]HPZ22324.1 AI-2E family transporter [Bacillota bacterium]HQD20235.1 AI-2E family transporter [Bacillota bacterium]